MKKLVLEFHKWRKMKPEEDQDIAAMFLFSLLPLESYEAGKRPSHNECFWTECSLSSHLASQAGWQKLSKDDKTRALFQNAVESIRAGHRMLRQAPLFWTPSNGLEKGPGDLSKVAFPKMPPTVLEGEAAESPRFGARAGAGLLE